MYAAIYTHGEVHLWIFFNCHFHVFSAGPASDSWIKSIQIFISDSEKASLRGVHLNHTGRDQITFAEAAVAALVATLLLSSMSLPKLPSDELSSLTGSAHRNSGYQNIFVGMNTRIAELNKFNFVSSYDSRQIILKQTSSMRGFICACSNFPGEDLKSQKSKYIKKFQVDLLLSSAGIDSRSEEAILWGFEYLCGFLSTYTGKIISKSYTEKTIINSILKVLHCFLK